MSRIAYVDGRYLPLAAAMVSVEDRGFQFGDGVYEVCEVRGGALIDERRHLDRLERSLAELRIAMPMTRRALSMILAEVVRRNRVRNGTVYLEVTRGRARRDHFFPIPAPRPTLVVSARPSDPASGEVLAAEGIAVITAPDERWARVDIKTVQLVPNILAKQAAREKGAREVWLVDRDGLVTEGGSTNAWIVTADGSLVTRPAELGILRGVTRTTLMDVAAALQIRVVERGFSVAEAKAAREAFVTGASTIVLPVVSIDGTPVGNGQPGSVARRLRAAFHAIAEVGTTLA